MKQNIHSDSIFRTLTLFLLLHIIVAYAQATTVTIDHQEATPGELVQVAVRGSDFTNVRGFQFQILYDNSILEFIKFTGIHPNFSDMLTNFSDTHVGVTYVNLYATSDLPDHEAIFYVEFKYCMDLPTCSINGTTTPLVFNEDECLVLKNSTEVPVTYNNGSVYTDTPIYTLYVTTSGAGNVTVDGGNYTEPVVVLGGTSLSLNATGIGESVFTGWSGDLSGTTTPQDLTMNSNKNVNASFSGESDVNELLILQNVTLPEATDTCFGATQTIVVGELGAPFIMQSGANAVMIAGERIVFKPATSIQAGSYLHAYIAPDGPFCDFQQKHFLHTNDLLVTTGIDQPPAEASQQKVLFRLYPNPTSGMLTIELFDSDQSSPTLLEVFDLTGNKLQMMRMDQSTRHTLDLSGLPPGIYIISVTSGEFKKFERVIKL